MAVTIDIGLADDIHPKNKQEVGRRLALVALVGSYGKNVSGSAPVFRNYRIKGDKMELDFGQKQDGFQIKGTTLKRLYHCRAGPCVLSGRGDGPEWENYSFFS